MNKAFLAVILLPAAGVIAATSDGSLETRMSELENKVANMEQADSKTLQGHWKDGFKFETPDEDFRLQLGGRVQLDTAFFDADPSLEEATEEFVDGIKFRRARLFMRGTLYGNLDFVAEYDFANSLGFRNVYANLKDVPVLGNIRAGHMLEPIGLEEYSSNNYITFMERGLPTYMNPAYNTGIMSFDALLDQRATWALGVFKDTGNLGDSVSNEEFAVSGRLTGLPYEADEGRRYLHTGYSMSFRGYDDTGYRIRARPDSYIAPYVIDTGNLDADTVTLSVLEFMLTIDSITLQGEWFMATADLNPTADNASPDDPDFTSYYVQAGYFLTGEYRPYQKKTGTFGRVIPKSNVTSGSMAGGAWEIAARYDGMDLKDSGIEGGEMDCVTVGLNWYLNPNARVMWNYVLADVQDKGESDIYQMRIQFDF